MKKTSLILLLVGNLASFQADAFQSFVVKSIRIEGLHRISNGAVLNDLPVHVGDNLSQARVTEAIHALYKTGFFKEVSLARDGSVLVVQVTERPTISKLTLSGIKDKEKALKGLREAGLAEGQLYDPAILARAQKELERSYFSRGKYGVRIEPVVTEECPGQVNVQLNIYEGDVAKIKQIEIIGNCAFPSGELLKQFHSATTNWLSWFSNDDQYAKEKLNADLEILRSYYMDRGFIHFQVDSTQVTLSPDKKEIHITVHVTEGDQYTFGAVRLEGQFVVPECKLEPLLSRICLGECFSRKTLFEVKQALEDRMGDEGFSLAEARPNHTVDEVNKSVDIVFQLIPSKRMYVRRILFRGNATTKDEVLRRELPQMEGTWVSTGLVKEGKDNILRRGFGSTVEVETPAIPGAPDQVDLVYNLEEARLGQVGAGLGYSPTERLMFNFSISQENFFGTGKMVDFAFDKSQASTNFSVGYQDPYFTIDRIGMGASAYYTQSNLSKTTNLSTYTTDVLGGEVRWVFPLGRYEAFRTSIGYDDTRLQLPVFALTAAQISSFVNKYGDKFQEYMLGVGWSYDSLDQRLFPKRGLSQTFDIRAVVPGANQQYYKTSYTIAWYQPISESERWIVNLSSNLGFGNGYGKTPQLPFYRNYTAGGTRFVRGFEENSLGPKDSLGRAFGGNALVTGTAALIFPNPIKPDAKSIRTSLFLDAGQVYDTRNAPPGVVNAVQVSSGLRYSVGISLTWHTPLGGAPLSFSLARALNAKAGDHKRPFTFGMGTQF